MLGRWQALGRRGSHRQDRKLRNSYHEQLFRVVVPTWRSLQMANHNSLCTDPQFHGWRPSPAARQVRPHFPGKKEWRLKVNVQTSIWCSGASTPSLSTAVLARQTASHNQPFTETLVPTSPWLPRPDWDKTRGRHAARSKAASILHFPRLMHLKPSAILFSYTKC